MQIASAFGIKPVQINDYSKSSYASSENQNLAFLVDTLLFILKQYEEELNVIAEDIAQSSMELLDILLKDRTTNKNIIWATND